jgi:hypothetical protein
MFFLLPYIPYAIRNCQKFRGIIRNSVSRNAAEFRGIPLNSVMFLSLRNFWKLPRRIRSHKRTASARESGLFDEKKEGQKSFDTVLICYRKSVIDLVVIFVEEDLIFRASTRVETKTHFSIFAKMRNYAKMGQFLRNFAKILRKFRENPLNWTVIRHPWYLWWNFFT